jgi:DNA-binding XRE family transcriptional regulator
MSESSSTKRYIQKTEDFSILLKQFRMLQKITQDELANFSGMHRNGISKIEQEDSDPKLSTVLNLLQLLGAKVFVELPPQVAITIAPETK